MNSELQPINIAKVLLPNRRYVFRIAQRPSAMTRAAKIVREWLRSLWTRFWLKQPRTLQSPLAKAHKTGSVIHCRLSMSHAIRVKSAEYWLMLGEPFEALAELQRLPETAKCNPWVVKVMVSAIGALRERGK